MDAISNVPKRNVLAEHLKEVIDVLEQKVGSIVGFLWVFHANSHLRKQGDQIAALYDCLEFKDKPLAQSVVYGKASSART